MTRIIALFNLKPGVSAADYEAWAHSTDMPMVRGLASVDRFDVMRSTGIMGSDDKPPYAYVEMIDVPDMAQFGEEVATEAAQKVIGQFGNFADNPLFILTEVMN